MVVLTIPGPSRLQRRWWLEGDDREALERAISLLQGELDSHDDPIAWWSRVGTVMREHGWQPAAR